LQPNGAYVRTEPDPGTEPFDVHRWFVQHYQLPLP